MCVFWLIYHHQWSVMVTLIYGWVWAFVTRNPCRHCFYLRPNISDERLSNLVLNSKNGILKVAGFSQNCSHVHLSVVFGGNFSGYIFCMCWSMSHFCHCYRHYFWTCACFLLPSVWDCNYPKLFSWFHLSGIVWNLGLKWTTPIPCTCMTHFQGDFGRWKWMTNATKNENMWCHLQATVC